MGINQPATLGTKQETGQRGEARPFQDLQPQRKGSRLKDFFILGGETGLGKVQRRRYFAV